MAVGSIAWGVATFIGAALAIAAKPVVELLVRRYWEKKAFFGELSDIDRHFDRNMVVVEAMIGAEPKPGFRLSDVHVRRLAILPDSLILQPESFRHLPPSWMSNVYHYKLLMRNMTLDLENLAAALNNAEPDEIALALAATRSRLVAARQRTIQLMETPDLPFSPGTGSPVLIWRRDDATRDDR